MATDCNLNRCLQRLCIPATDWKCSNSTRSGFSFTVGPLPPQAEQCLNLHDRLSVSLTYSHTCQQQAHQVRHLTWKLWDRVFKTRTYIRKLCHHTSFDESDGTVSGADSVQISFRSNTQSSSHRLPGGLQNLDCPLSLFHMLKVLKQEANESIQLLLF